MVFGLMDMLKIVLWTAIRTVFRFQEVLGVLTVLILYVSLSTGFLAVANFTVAEVDYVKHNIVLSGQNYCVEEKPGGKAVIFTGENTSILYRGRSIGVTIYYTLDPMSLSSNGAVKFKGNPSLISGTNVSVGKLLSSTYGITIGDLLYASYPNGTTKFLRVVAIHYAGGQLDLSLLMKGGGGAGIVVGGDNGVCYNRRSVFVEVVTGINNEVLRTTCSMLLFLFIIIVVVVISSVYRLGYSLKKFMIDLYLQGFSRRYLFAYYFTVSVITGVLGWLLGSSLGLVVSQASSFALRFYGVILPFKPFITTSDLVFVLILSLTPSAIAPLFSWRMLVGYWLEEIKYA